MYFVDVIKVLLRRWYVVLVGMLLVAGALVYAIKEVPTQYQATGQVLILLPPKATGPNTPTNPYMNLAPGLVTTATLIAEQLNNTTNHAAVKDAGFTSEYALGVVPDTGPLLVITAKDTNAREADQTMEEVVTRVGAQLDRMQANLEIPENQYMHTRRNDTNAGAQALPGSKIRAAGVLGGGGIVLTVVCAFLLDGFMRRRKAKQPDEPDTVQELNGKKSRLRGRKVAAAESDEPQQLPRPRAVSAAPGAAQRPKGPPVGKKDPGQARPGLKPSSSRAAGAKRS